MIDFLCHIEILVLNILELLKVSGFSRIFDQNSRFFQFFFKISQVPGFFLPKLSNSRFFKFFPGIAATLLLTFKYFIYAYNFICTGGSVCRRDVKIIS